MIELSKERVDEILNEETLKTVELPKLLRAIYNRYRQLYENYFADLDALNDEKVAELRNYHEETKSLIKYYYMDIPYDVCEELEDFEEKYGTKLLGADWHENLTKIYEEFEGKAEDLGKSEEELKAEFKEEILGGFYDAMSDAFRVGFGTSSKTHEKVVDGIKGLFFGKG